MSSEKQVLLNNLIKEIDSKKNLYEKKTIKLKNIDNILEIIISFMSVSSTSVLIIGLTHLNPILLITGTVLSSLSGILNAVKNVSGIQRKIEIHKTTFLNLKELSRESKIILARNHLTSDDKINLLNDISNRLSLIDDSSIPITERSKHLK
jgi:hypothetical protein